MRSIGYAACATEKPIGAMAAVPGIDILRSRGGLRLYRGAGVNLLRGGHAGSVLHREPISVENDFEAREHGEEVGEIEIADVRDAE